MFNTRDHFKSISVHKTVQSNGVFVSIMLNVLHIAVFHEVLTVEFSFNPNASSTADRPFRHDPLWDQRAAGETGVLQEGSTGGRGAGGVSLLSCQKRPVERGASLQTLQCISRHREHLLRAQRWGPAHWPITPAWLKHRNVTVPLFPIAAPQPAGYCSWWEICCFWRRPAGHGSALGEVHNRSIRQKAVKGPQSEFAHILLAVCSDNNPTWIRIVFVIFSFFVHHVSSVFRIFMSSLVSVCFLPTVKLNEASGAKSSDLPEVDATSSGGFDSYMQEDSSERAILKKANKIMWGEKKPCSSLCWISMFHF